MDINKLNHLLERCLMYWLSFSSFHTYKDSNDIQNNAFPETENP